MTTLRPSSLRDRLRGSARILAKELAAFGFIGAIAFVIDLGVFAWLTPIGSVKANIVSTLCSTTFAYFGNRHLSFSHRARTGLGREAAYFFGINLVTLAFSSAMLAIFVYGAGFDHTSTGILVVKLVSIGVGTVFRFWAYKRFVFLHPDRVHAKDIDLDEELAE